MEDQITPSSENLDETNQSEEQTTNETTEKHFRRF